MNYKVTQISVDNRRQVIEKYFSYDPELISTYHIVSGTDITTCAKKTHEDLNNVIDGFKFYEIEGIGFFGVEDDGKFLTGFFVHPNYRKKETIGPIWKLIKSYLNETFYVGIYKKNTRALDFLLGNGGTLYRLVNNQNNVAIFIAFKENF